MLLYTSKGVTATNQFKVHGQLPLHGMIVSIIIHCLLLSRFLSLAWSHFSHHGLLFGWKVTTVLVLVLVCPVWIKRLFPLKMHLTAESKLMLHLVPQHC